MSPRTKSVRFPGVPADLDGPLHRIERAKEHIIDHRSCVKAWSDPQPYKTSLLPYVNDPDRRVIRIDEIDEVPVDIPLIVGDAIHNLVSALDNLMCVLIARNGLTPCPDGSYFPIRKTAEDVKTTLCGIRGLDAPTKERIRSFKPYEAGDAILWALKQLNNRDKHRMLLTAGLGVFVVPEDETGFPVPIKPQMLKPGDHYLLSKAKEPEDPGIMVQVAFNEPRLKPWYVTGFMLRAVARVDEIVRSFT